MSDGERAAFPDVSSGKHLFWVSGSPQSWAIAALISHKELNVSRHMLSWQNGETKGPEIKKLNPREEVPIFVDDGLVVTENLAILFHIEATYSDHPTLSKDAQTRAKILTKIFECGNIQYATFNIARALYSGQAHSNTELQGEYRKVYTELDHWECALEGQKYAAGTDDLSLADIRLFPLLAFLQRLGLELDDRFDNLARYIDHCHALPAFSDNYPPHWKTSPPSFNMFSLVDGYSERDAAAIEAVRFIGFK